MNDSQPPSATQQCPAPASASVARLLTVIGACSMLALCFMSLAVGAAELRLEGSDDGRVIARSPDGAIVWRVDRAGSGPLAVERDGHGLYLIDHSLLVDRLGRVVERMRGAEPRVNGAEETTGALGWDVPVQISQNSEFEYSPTAPPLVDSNADMWVILDGLAASGDSSLEVTRSVDRGGTWNPPEILHTTSNNIFPPASVIDASDRITVAYREIVPDVPDQINVFRYLPGTGWSGPHTIYTSDISGGFQNVYSAVDAIGNVIVSFDGDAGAMYTLVYDAASDVWGQATRLSPDTAGQTWLPTLIQNRSGTAVYAIYQVFADAGQGIHLRRFRSATLDWAPPRRVPGTVSAQIPGGQNTGSRIPAVVDDQGNVTVPYYVSTQIGPARFLHQLRAARLEGGAWVAARTVMAHVGSSGALPSFSDFADMDYSADRDVFMVFPRSGQRSFKQALHYDAGTGAWDAPAILFSYPQTGETRMRVAVRDDGSALATYLARDSEAYFASRLFAGGIWQPQATIPGNPAESFHETTASGLDVLMVYGDVMEYATWFRDALANQALAQQAH